MFTGDRSGDWLFEALYVAGFANQPTSERRDDGLALRDAYVTAAARCAPPDNKPTPAEMERCAPYLEAELRLFRNAKVIIALGRIGWIAYLRARQRIGQRVPRPLPAFGHGARADLGDGMTLLGTYHPSQQNTFTGRLTRPMLHAVFMDARALLNPRGPRAGAVVRPR
jgi:uracil-DNA glycosylase family 4